MPRFQVQKFVAVCFLEAAKTVIDQLGQFRMELSQKGMEGPRELPSLYGEIRRLRDYLQRCLGAYADVVQLDVGPEDQGLLVAVCRRAVEILDLHLEPSRKLAGQEREWLQQKRQSLSDWAVELAQKPLIELPLPRLSPVPTAGFKALNLRITTKVFGGGRVEAGPQGGITGVDPMFGGSPQASAKGDSAAMPPIGLQTSGGQPVEMNGGFNAALSGSGFGQGPTMSVPPGAGMSAAETQALIESKHVRDPRLRALMSLDVRAYERAIEARDHRLAAVHLSSILEGAVLDHAIPRRAELGLLGAPDSWNPQEILLQILGDQVTPKDRSLVYHVFAARNLIRPGAQLVAPAVVTPQSLEKLTDFVRRALHHMGYQSPSAAAPTPRVLGQVTGPGES